MSVLAKVWGCAEVMAPRLVKAEVFVAGGKRGPVRVEAWGGSAGAVRAAADGPGLKPQLSPCLVRGAEAPRFHRNGQCNSGLSRLALMARGDANRRSLRDDNKEGAAGVHGRLHLVRASAAAAAEVEVHPTMVADGPIALRHQAAEVRGIGYAFYRKYTEAVLRRYMTMSFENGRVPSLLGRELFGGHNSSFTINSFEDVSNFVHDVGRCVETLDAGQQHLVRRIALEEYTMDETAAMLGMSLRTVVRRYREAVDRMTRVLLERGLMQPLERGEEGLVV